MIEIFSFPFMQNALLASSLIGVLCAVLGVYTVLKRVVFFSAALAQISTTAIALAFFLGLSAPLTSLTLTALAIIIFATKTSWGRIPLDGVLGITYVGAFALSILLIAKSPLGMEELHHLLQGNILTVTSGQVYLLIGLFILVGCIQLLFRREFTFISFDPAMARTQGYNVEAWNLLLYFSMGLVISFGIRVCGVLLIFAMLVVPAVIALQWVRDMKKVFLIAIGVNLVAVLIGLIGSFLLDLPSGPAIVAVLISILLGGMLLRTVVRN
jgi:ABC-type Mn2+/Zn2+ transport system permease subunit